MKSLATKQHIVDSDKKLTLQTDENLNNPEKVYFWPVTNFFEDETIWYLGTDCSNHMCEKQRSYFFARRIGEVYSKNWQQ